jgi:predicted PurR-regulated permease PerM
VTTEISASSNQPGSGLNAQLWWLASLATLLVAIGLWGSLLLTFYTLLVLLSLSLLITYVLLGPVNALERWLARAEERLVRWKWLGRHSFFKVPVPRPRVLAILLVYLTLSLLLLLGINRGLPFFADQAQDLLTSIPTYWNKVVVWAQQAGSPWAELVEQINRFIESGNTALDPSGLKASLDSLITKVSEWLANVLSDGPGLLSNTVNQFIYAVTLTIFPFYFLLDGRRLSAKAVSFLPEANQRFFKTALRDMHQVFQAYVFGQVLLGLITGLYMTVVYTLLGVKAAVILGSIFFLAELIPVVGTWLGITPGLIVAFFSGGLWVAFFVFLCSYGYQTIKDNIVAPKITGDVMGLHPIIIIVALLVGVKLAGLMGILVAIPVAGILKALWLRLVTKDTTTPVGELAL